MDYLYTVYINVIKMITEKNYRNMILIDPQLSQKELENRLQINKFIIINAKSSKTEPTENISSFYLLHHDETFTRKVPDFRKLMNKVVPNIKDIYLISNKKFGPQVYKIMISMKNVFNIRLYKHKIFSFEIPKHVLCSKHEIISNEEEKQLLMDMNLSSKLLLPKILENDPQCIWIGAKPSDIIRIIRSNISGETCTYRIVIGIIANKIISSTIPAYLGPEYLRPKIIIPKMEIQKKEEKKENIKRGKEGKEGKKGKEEKKEKKEKKRRKI